MQIDRMAAVAVLAIAILFVLIVAIHPLSSLPLPEGERQGTTAPAMTPGGPPVAVTKPAAIATLSSLQVSPGTGDVWAKIDPVPDIPAGRVGNVTVTGTTNAPAGVSLRIDFIARSMHPSPMEYDPGLWFGETVQVRTGDAGINQWSAEVRPQDFRKPDSWQILVTDTGSGVSIGSGMVNVTA